jgi:hypothetical protein
VFRPLFFNYPKDEALYGPDVVESQFMLGRGLMSCPILENNATNRVCYFPEKAAWFVYETGEVQMTKEQPLREAIITNFIRDSPPIFLPSGTLLQTYQFHKVDTIRDLKPIYTLIVAPEYVKNRARVSNSDKSGERQRICHNESFLCGVARGQMVSVQRLSNELKIKNRCLKDREKCLLRMQSFMSFIYQGGAKENTGSPGAGQTEIRMELRLILDDGSVSAFNRGKFIVERLKFFGLQLPRLRKEVKFLKLETIGKTGTQDFSYMTPWIKTTLV